MHSEAGCDPPISTKLAEAKEGAGYFCSILKSIDAFAELEVKGVMMGLLTPTISEECLLASYYRASANVKTLLELQNISHFQAIGMLARSMFELAVDMKLMELDPRAVLKMTHFKDVEKLRACRDMVAFSGANRRVYTKETGVQESFIKKQEERILTLADQIWLGVPIRRITIGAQWLCQRGF